jgi:YfiH family protein
MLERRTSVEGVVYYASPILSAAGVPHAFSTRLGGVSAAPFESLNLGNPAGCEAHDPSDNVRVNEQRLLRAAGGDGREFCRVHQVHGRAVARAERGKAFDVHEKADAIVSDDPARALSVRVADCVPVLLASKDGRMVAAVHAGWRGVVAGVVPAAIEAMALIAGHSSLVTGHLLAAIGPSISGEAFEVGPEVVEIFSGLFDGAAIARRLRNGKASIDLRHAIYLQLLKEGVEPGRVDMTDRCTYRDAGEFFSHRRDHGITGRMAAVIGAVARESVAQ